MKRSVLLFLSSINLMSISLYTMNAWKLDKKQLIKSIGNLMYKQQVHEMGLRYKGPEDFINFAQGNQELAQDFLDLNEKCLFSGKNQEFMTQFCKKWNIKQLSASYNEEDYE